MCGYGVDDFSYGDFILTVVNVEHSPMLRFWFICDRTGYKFMAMVGEDWEGDNTNIGIVRIHNDDSRTQETIIHLYNHDGHSVPAYERYQDALDKVKEYFNNSNLWSYKRKRSEEGKTYVKN